MTGTGKPPGDAAAFCAAEYPQLVRALSLYVGDADTAEELAQEALLRACRQWASVSRLESPGGWTWRVATNLDGRTVTSVPAPDKDYFVKESLPALLEGHWIVHDGCQAGDPIRSPVPADQPWHPTPTGTLSRGSFVTHEATRRGRATIRTRSGLVFLPRDPTGAGRRCREGPGPPERLPARGQVPYQHHVNEHGFERVMCLRRQLDTFPDRGVGLGDRTRGVQHDRVGRHWREPVQLQSRPNGPRAGTAALDWRMASTAPMMSHASRFPRRHAVFVGRRRSRRRLLLAATRGLANRPTRQLFIHGACYSVSQATSTGASQHEQS